MRCLQHNCLLFLLMGLLCTQVNTLVVIAQSAGYEIEQLPVAKEIPGFIGASIIQDNEGYMWFGTRHGLFRYDGTGFRAYHSDPGDSTSLSNETAYSLLVDNEGILWVGTSWGLNRYDRNSDSFVSYADSTTAYGVSSMYDSGDGYLWLGSRWGLKRFDKSRGIIKEYLQECGGEGCNIVFNLIGDRSGNLWIRNLTGITVFNRDTETFETIENAPGKFNSLSYEDRSGRFWVCTSDGLYLLDRKTRTFHRHFYREGDPNRLTDQYVRTIMDDSEGNLWIRTLDGIYCYNPELELVYTAKHSSIYSKSVDHFSVTRTIIQDNAGTIWFPTPDGVSKIHKVHNNFRTYDPDLAEYTFIGPIHVEDDRNIWFGARESIFRYDRKLDRYDLICNDLRDPSDSSLLLFSSLYLDRSGFLWAGTGGWRLFRGSRNKEGGIDFKTIDLGFGDVDPTDHTGIGSIFEDREGRIWIGSRYEVPMFYDPVSEQVVRLKIDADPAANDGTHCAVQAELGSGELLALGGGGLWRIKPPFSPIDERHVEASQTEMLKDRTGEKIRGVRLFRSKIDTTGLIWVLGWNNGLERILHESGTPSGKVEVKRYSMKQGLPSNNIRAVQEDRHGNLWLGTEGGLSRFDPDDETFTNFYKNHGLPTNYLHFGSFRCDDGEMFFGTRDGFFSFFPDSIRYNTTIPPVVITGVKANNQPVSPEFLDLTSRENNEGELPELPYNVNNLSFHFAALNFIKPQMNQYRYMLEGVNRDWIYSGNRNYVEYGGLEPGKYTFRVVGSNNDGIWNEQGPSVEFLIRFPPWRTWWAFVIYGIFLLVPPFLFYRYVVSRARLRTEMEVEKIEKDKFKELDRLKSRFFASISHEFRTPLTLLLGPISNLLSNTSGFREEEFRLLTIMERNARRLKQLINQLLDMSKMESGNMNVIVREGNLTHFVRTLSNLFLSLAESKNIEYRIGLEETGSDVVFDSDKIEKILVNLLSNAFKYTAPGGTVDFSLEYISDSGTGIPSIAKIRIRDTGKGIPENHLDKIFDRFYVVDTLKQSNGESLGLGLSLAKELVDLLKGSIHVESQVGRGTIFTVSLPVSRSDYRDCDREEQDTVFRAEGNVKELPVYPDMIEETGAVHAPMESGLPQILLVEDNADLRVYLSDILRPEFNIRESANGKKGLEMAIQYIPDLIVSDLMMPVMDGREMCRKLKSDIRTNHIPVIILTARADRRSKLEGLDIGADDYIIKPFDNMELLARTRNLISQRKKLREKYRLDFINTGEEPLPESPDDQMVSQVMKILTDHIEDPSFTMTHLAEELSMSRPQLYRKISAVTGFTPNDLFRKIRLKRAAALFNNGHNNVTQVMYQVGFNNPSHFAKSFKELYQLNPSEYLKSGTM